MNLEKGSIMAIIRGVEPEEIIDIQSALIESGVKWVEVSLSEEEKGLECIAKLNEFFGSRIHLGVGTVTTEEQAEKAIDAGAKYLVTPGWDRELIRKLKKLEVGIFPGVYTPGEVMQAINEGIEVVKLFPADSLQPNYLKSLKGPFPNVQVMAVGGITLDNIAEYQKIGFHSFGIGSDLVPRGATKKDLESIKTKARSYINALKK